MRLLVWHLVQSDWCPYYKKGKFGHTRRHRDVKIQRKDHVGTQQRVPICKKKKETSGETNPAGWRFQPPKL